MIVQGEYGKLFVLHLGLNVTAANTVEFLFTDPAGVASTKNAIVGLIPRSKPSTGSSVSGEWAYYTIQSGFFDSAGQWAVQAKATWTGTKVVKSQEQHFWVGEG